MWRRRLLIIGLVFLTPVARAGGFGNTAPTVTSVQVSPAPIPAGSLVTVSCTGNDSDGTVQQMRVTVSAGTLSGGTSSQLLAVVPAASVTASVGWSTPAPGSYTVTCGVADSGGSFGGPLTGFATISVVVVQASVGLPPSLALTVTAAQVFGNGTTHLSASAVDPEGEVLTYAWAATGGAFLGSGAEVDWVAPAAAGPHALTVRVDDPGGNSATTTVSVEVVVGRTLPPLARPGLSPSRLAADATGSFWVADARARELVLLSPFGQTLRTVPLGFRPGGVAVAPGGTLYVCDLDHGAVHLISPLGAPQGALGRGPAEFVNPVDVAIDRLSGDVFVADLAAQSVRVFSPQGMPLLSIATAGFPSGLTIDPLSSTVYVADGANGTVQAFSTGGVLRRTIGSFGGAPGSVTRPAGVALDGAGRLFVVDGFQARLAVFEAAGPFQAFMSSGTLQVPVGATLDPSGRLVVANSEVGRLEVFELPGALAPESACPADLARATAPGSCTAAISSSDLEVKGQGQGGTTEVAASTVPVGNLFALGTTPVSYTVTDSRSAFVCTQVVTVLDREPPALSCSGPVAVEASPGSCGTSVSAALLSATANDNCGPVTLVQDRPAFLPVGQSSVAATASDSAGNSARCEQTVTVLDREPPRISCPPDVVVEMAGASCEAEVPPTQLAAGVADNCRATSQRTPLAVRFPAGVTEVRHTATDPSGNSADCLQSVRVVDTQPPVVSCGAALTLDTSPGLCAVDAPAAAFGPTFSDNCAATIEHDGPASLTPGTISVTFTARDSAGNTASCVRAVTVRDTEPPRLACPPDVLEFTLPGVCEVAVDSAMLRPQAGDNCGLTLTALGVPPGNRFPRGLTVVTHTAVDAAGLRVSCAQQIVVSGVDQPTLTCTRLQVSADPGECSARVAGAQLTARVDGACASAITHGPVPPGGQFPVGTTSIVHTATDGTGWTADCEQQVVVEDREPPALTCPADLRVAASPDWCGAALTGATLTAGATDNCGRPTVVRSGVPAGDRFAVGVTLVGHEAVDQAGNASSCIQAAVVVDRTPPLITCPADQTLECAFGGAVASFQPSASDNCATAVACSAPSGSRFATGTTVSCTATDPGSTAAACAFTIAVPDTAPPQVLTRDFTVYTADRAFEDNVAGPLAACGAEPALPFELSDCVSAATDQCVGPLDPMRYGSVSRVEFWAQAPMREVASGWRRTKRLNEALRNFDQHGCQRFSLTGPASAALPFEGLAQPLARHGLYRVYFEIADGNGGQTAGRCEVRVLRERGDEAAILALPPGDQPAPLGCVACVGAGCGACPAPAAACESAQRCAPGARTPAAWRQEHCVTGCGAETVCAAGTLACLAGCQKQCEQACTACGVGGSH